MKWLVDLKISIKLLAGFMMIALLAGVLGFIGITNLRSADTNYTQLFNLYGKPLGDVGRAGIQFEKIRCYLRDLAMNQDPEAQQKTIDNMERSNKILKEYLVRYQKTIQTANNRKLFNELSLLISQFNGIRDQATGYALHKNNQQYMALLKDPVTVKVITGIEDLLNKLFEGKITNGNVKADEYARLTARTMNVMILIVLIAFLGAAGLGILVARSVSRPVQELVLVAEKIAQGDLNVDLKVKNNDELGILMRSFTKMAQNTNEVLANINSAAAQVSAGAKQVAISSQTLSQGSTEQAASLEEITSSVTEVAAQTKQNAVNANQANQLSLAAKDSAIDGNQQMQGMLKAMEEINISSAGISKIIKVIDEIAFQTNILALNAAVEAARAGQHGKGFAVVAEEVRNLAARSANAAKETTAMIESSIKKVEAGTKIANDTAEALSKIVTGVAEATNLVAEIANASNQQASAIAQINQGIEQVSQVTQANTATAEESAAASEELSGQAELLKKMVGRFKIRREQSSLPLPGLNPDVLKAIETIIGGQKGRGYFENQDVATPAEAAGSAAADQTFVKINLDGSDFGKY